jgi:3-deoxy-7-phosphoheptulonate synthase
MIQVGARSMYNAALLAAVGRCGRPVLLKRGMTASVEELLQSAELIAATGNSNIVLCERGIRTYGRLTRNTCDLGAVAVLNLLTRLPVIVDPSHATGQTVLVPVLSRAAVAVGADGLMVEMHPAPKGALSDGLQSLTFDEFRLMMQSLQPYIALRTKNALACESDV